MLTVSDKLWLLTEVLSFYIAYRYLGNAGLIGACLGAIAYQLWSL